MGDFDLGFQRGRAVGLHQAGVSLTDVARCVGVSRRTVVESLSGNRVC